MSQIFEQQPRETARAFEAFQVYLGMGADRSLARVGAKLGKNTVTIERWSAKFGWLNRVKAHAEYLAEAEREATAVLVRAKAVDWVKRREVLLESEWEMHGKCLEAARKALDAFLAKPIVYANLADISRMLEVASKLGRLASGMATDKTEVTGEGGGALRVEFSQALDRVYGVLADGHQGTVVDAEVVTPKALPEVKS